MRTRIDHKWMGFQSRSGLTLIELLAVIAIIGVLVGVIGFTFRGSDKARGLRAGQTVLASMLTVARGTAALKGATAYLLVNVDTKDADRYLRYLTVIYESVDVDGSSYSPKRWMAVNAGAYLPEGVFFVPDDIASRGITWSGEISGAPSRDFELSELIEPFATEVSLANGNWHGFSFTQYGTSSSRSLVLTTGKSRPSGVADPAVTIEFLNTEMVAGAKLRNYGNFTLAGSEADFQ